MQEEPSGLELECISLFYRVSNLKTFFHSIAGPGTLYDSIRRLLESDDSPEFALFLNEQEHEGVTAGHSDHALLKERAASALALTIERTLDAACLVFAHSVLDQCVNECVHLICRSRPDLVERELKRKELKVTLREIQVLGYDGLLSRQINIFERRVKRKPLVQRVSWILRLCRPKRAADGERYRLDLDLVRGIDEQRHKIVHKPELSPTIPVDVLFHCRATCLFLISAVERLGIPFSRYSSSVNGLA